MQTIRNTSPYWKALMFALLPLIVLSGYVLAQLGWHPGALIAAGAVAGLGYGWLGLVGFKVWLAGCDPTLARVWHIVFQTSRTRGITIVLVFLLYLVSTFKYKTFPHWTPISLFVFSTLLVGLPVELLLIKWFMRSDR